MGKNFLEIVGEIVLSRTREAVKGTPQTAGLAAMDFDSGSMFNVERTIENDAEDIHGSELPTDTFFASQQVTASLAQARAKPDFLLWALAQLLGLCSSSSAGSTSYLHSITRDKDNLDHPSFTALQRSGDILKERFAGNHVQTVTIEVGESWVAASADVVGMGLRETNWRRDEISTAADTTVLTLNDGVEGATEAIRLENVQEIRSMGTAGLSWSTRAISAVNSADPATCTISAAFDTTTSDSIDVLVTYIADEPSWCTFPAKASEPPLRCTDAQVMLGAHWDGSSLSGGYVLDCAHLLGITFTGENEVYLHHGPCADGTVSANSSKREGTSFRFTLSQHLRDAIMEHMVSLTGTDKDDVAVRLLLQGPEIDAGEGYYYGLEIICPKCRLVANARGTEGKRNSQAPELLVLDDGTYDGIIIRGWNQQSAYMTTS